MRPSIFTLALTAVLVTVRFVQAAPGDLDPSFGVAGKVLGPLPASPANIGIIDGLIQPDGRIVVCGNSIQDGRYTMTVARFEPNGTLDTTFGTGGVATMPLEDGDDVTYAIVRQPDGRLIVAGEIDRSLDSVASGDMVVVRLLADGTLDPSFGDGGVVRTSFGPNADTATSVVYQPNGKIVIGGVMNVDGVNRFALARLEANGSLDLTFGNGGKVVTALGVTDGLIAMALQPDGKIVAGGNSRTDVVAQIAFARYLPNGMLDASFGTGGVSLMSIGPTLVQGVNDIVLQPDGKIVGGGIDGGVAVVRIDANGALDPTFGNGGALITSIAGAFLADAVLVQPDGRVIAAGYRYHSGANADYDSLLLRIDSAGALDPGFGAGGAVVTDMGPGDFMRAVRRQLDGKLVAMGSYYGVDGRIVAMARYEGTPAACGNGVPEEPESCDDGNVTAGDGCDATCDVEPGFACAGMPSVCTPGCGDATIGGSEECDDGALAAGDGCDAACRIEAGWTCAGTPSACVAVCGDSRIVGGEHCDDGNTNNGDCCNASCQLETAGSPCLDEGDPCSTDVCGAGGVCQHDVTPDATCLLPTAPEKAQLKIVLSGPGKNRVQFKWTKGPAVPKAAFGMPATGTPVYALCVYGATGGTPALALGAVASGDGDCSDHVCWTEKPTAWKLKSKTGAPSGIVGVKLQQGLLDGKSQVQVSLKGANLVAPTLPLASDPRVVAQVRSSDGQCYGATFSTPKTNESALYRAKSD